MPKMLFLSQCGKVKIFFATRILREMNFGLFQKVRIVQELRLLIFGKIHFSKCLKFTKILNEMQKWQILIDDLKSQKIDFT